MRKKRQAVEEQHSYQHHLSEGAPLNIPLLEALAHSHGAGALHYDSMINFIYTPYITKQP